ncbi:gamma-glutamyltransferase family protein [Gryllotalpicola protaetiae]|uniref:Transferase n=1 Tax=Gryllotalpicola protaetiae TaxID=2419771 RepID=A0A387BKX8_9MICO|nr:gamma-glutamyltransferase [Gryllotalpicola protaetiae]AYG03308.1 transferase [Gryllotalpicola protaetiae]
MPFSTPDAFTTRPTLRGSFGMAASTHWLATATAQSVLERGGNAFDAAVAAGFVLHVVEPHLNGPGGDLTGLFATDAEGVRVFMGQGAAPARATIEHYRDVEGLTEIPGSGALAAAVPGAVDAWLWLLAAHGTWELDAVLRYAIGYAQDGHPVAPGVVTTIERIAPHFRAHWPSSAALWLDEAGNAPRPHAVVTNPAYAQVLLRLIAAGPDDGTRVDRIDAARAVWKTGFVAQAMESFAAQPHWHSDGREHAGVLQASDLALFEPGAEEPVTLDFRGLTIAKTGPWGQGPVLLQMLAILEAYGRLHGLTDEHLDPSTAFGIHVIAEAEKLALADRDAWYGDPAFVDVPLATLLSPAYAEERAALIGERASAELRPGSPDGRVPVALTGAQGVGKTGLVDDIDETDASAEDAAPGDDPGAELATDANGQTRGDTCHLDVIDAAGNLVTVTPSGGWLQSSPTIPELGFCLGTRLQMSWLDESSPSALRPGARPRTTLSATLVIGSDGSPLFSLGTPGGDQQDQWQLPALLRMIVGGWDAQQAIDAPAFHTTSHLSSFWPRVWEPAGLIVEGRVGASVIAELEARGHRVTVPGDWSLGRLSAVGRAPSTGTLWAAANPRGAQGYAAGR